MRRFRFEPGDEEKKFRREIVRYAPPDDDEDHGRNMQIEEKHVRLDRLERERQMENIQTVYRYLRNGYFISDEQILQALEDIENLQVGLGYREYAEMMTELDSLRRILHDRLLEKQQKMLRLRYLFNISQIFPVAFTAEVSEAMYEDIKHANIIPGPLIQITEEEYFRAVRFFSMFLRRIREEDPPNRRYEIGTENTLIVLNRNHPARLRVSNLITIARIFRVPFEVIKNELRAHGALEILDRRDGAARAIREFFGRLTPADGENRDQIAQENFDILYANHRVRQMRARLRPRPDNDDVDRRPQRQVRRRVEAEPAAEPPRRNPRRRVRSRGRSRSPPNRRNVRQRRR